MQHLVHVSFTEPQQLRVSLEWAWVLVVVHHLRSDVGRLVLKF